MRSILVVDDMAVFREPIALALRQRGFETQTADDGIDALRQIEACKPDIVLLDLAMPRMDGLAFLRTLRAQARHKDIAVILLTAVGDRAKIIEAGQLGVRDYLLKSRFSIDELCSRIRKYTAPADSPQTTAANEPSPQTSSAKPPVPAQDAGTRTKSPSPLPDSTEALQSVKPILSRSEINERIESAVELKALSPTVGQLMKLTSSANCSIQSVANTIRQDQALALKVLKLANSAVYTRGEKVESVQQAVTRIGLKHIREVTMNISVMDRFSDPDIAAVLDTNDFWEHAIATGLIAAQIVRSRNGNDTETNAAFTMGLLHDVGRMVFAEQFADAYKQVLDAAEHLALPLEQVESRMLLVNHADLMDKLLHLWKFSKALIDPIALHHLSIANARGLAPRTVSEVAVLSLANRMSHAMLLGTSGNNTIYPFQDLVDFLRLTDTQMAAIERDITQQVQDMKYTMLSQSDSPGKAQPLREKIIAQFTSPIRPLYVSAKSGSDAFRSFTAGITQQSDAPANIAVVHINAPSERATVTQQLMEAEKEAKLPKLPTIILSRKGNILLEDQAMHGREHQSLSTPTPVARFVEAANNLLDAAPASAAA